MLIFVRLFDENLSRVCWIESWYGQPFSIVSVASMRMIILWLIYELFPGGTFSINKKVNAHF